MPITDAGREERVKYVCSSDMPSILTDVDGAPVSPFARDANSVWETKDPNGVEGLVKRGLPLVNGETTEAQACGNMVEDGLVAWATEQTGILFVTDMGKLGQPRALWFTKDHSGTHPDGLNVTAVGDQRRRKGCEVKLVGGHYAHEWGESGSVIIPLHVEVQVHHQMAVADLECVYVAAFICGRSPERRLYCIERDEDWVTHLLEAAEKFWTEHVVTGIPPEPNWAPSMPILKARTREPESTIDLGEDAVAAIEAWQALNDQKLELEKEVKAAQRLALAGLGDAEGGMCDAGTLTYLMQNGAPKIDRNAMKMDGVYDTYATPTEHRVLRWKAAKT